MACALMACTTFKTTVVHLVSRAVESYLLACLICCVRNQGNVWSRTAVKLSVTAGERHGLICAESLRVPGLSACKGIRVQLLLHTVVSLSNAPFCICLPPTLVLCLSAAGICPSSTQDQQ